MIRGLLRSGTTLLGCLLVKAGLRLIGDAPPADDFELPDFWGDEVGPDVSISEDVVGAFATSETSLYLVPPPDEGRATSSFTHEWEPEPLEGSLAWRARERGARPR